MLTVWCGHVQVHKSENDAADTGSRTLSPKLYMRRCTRARMTLLTVGRGH